MLRGDARPKRAIVEVRLGPLSSRKAILDPGHTLHVGRSNLADLCFPHDNAMSTKHLAITWDGERARVRDLGSGGRSERVGGTDALTGGGR